MKTMRIFSAIIALLMITFSLSLRSRRKNNTCNPPCTDKQYCTSFNTCEAKKKQGESCSAASTSVTDQCEKNCTCQKNTVTGNDRCVDSKGDSTLGGKCS